MSSRAFEIGRGRAPMNADILSTKVIIRVFRVHPRPIFQVRLGGGLARIEIPQWLFSLEEILLKK
jgi:hypothetical protein